MKKSILIVHYSMELGGAESSLLGILQTLDYSKVQVDLLLFKPDGELIGLIPKEVNVLKTPKPYLSLALPIKAALCDGSIFIVLARLISKVLVKVSSHKPSTYIIKQYVHKISLPFLPKIKEHYNLAISFIDPHYIVGKKVDADVRLSWLHTDFSRVDINRKMDYEMWNLSDYIVNVSESCKKAFDRVHPGLREKSIVIENILSEKFVFSQAHAFELSDEMSAKGILLLSIGRFSQQKNFDNVPDICRRLREDGLDVTWYLIGYGGEEQLIRERIAASGMLEHVIILGKKTNPYPYIKKCDVYVQPSRYEGKAVTVREAQILNKPVIITNYVTAPSQLTDGVDGIIVPMDNEECAKGIARVLRDKELLNSLIENTKKNDYTNRNEINKLYACMGD